MVKAHDGGALLLQGRRPEEHQKTCGLVGHVTMYIMFYLHTCFTFFRRFNMYTFKIC